MKNLACGLHTWNSRDLRFLRRCPSSTIMVAQEMRRSSLCSSSAPSYVVTSTWNLIRACRHPASGPQ